MIGFVIAGGVALVCAAGVILARNPVHSIVWLAAHLVAVAVLFLLLGLEFLGLVQILIYAGAVLVLFLFVVGLLQSGKGPLPLGPDRVRGLAIWGGAAVLLLAAALASVGARLAAAPSLPAPDGFGSVAAFGQLLFGPYLIPFEVTAAVLLVAVVAVVALAREPEA